MGDMMMYAVIAGIAAGVFFYMFKKSAAAITNQLNLKTARYAVRNCKICYHGHL